MTIQELLLKIYQIGLDTITLGWNIIDWLSEAVYLILSRDFLNLTIGQGIVTLILAISFIISLGHIFNYETSKKTKIINTLYCLIFLVALVYLYDFYIAKILLLLETY
tara:strand:+ start:309 stop:632 length:324 start_codon:yes stop_codon:yes gene_type:complete